jgi:RNA binding exosome subunit
MENKTIPLSEKIITQSEFNYRHQGWHGNPLAYEKEDVKQSINECLEEILELNLPTREERLEVFKKYFGNLIE